MVDIHHHLLFGIDDGSKTLEHSVAMVTMAAQDGITHIVATPHANDRYAYDRAGNEVLLQQLRDALPLEVATKIKLGLGCDFHVNFENIQALQQDKHRYTINQHEYLLIELPDIGLPANMAKVLYDMRTNGVTPILTHPERNATLQRTPEKLQEWVEAQLLIQVTAGSLTGTFGPTAKSLAWNLMKKQWVHFVATDAHNLDRRSPILSEAYKAVTKRMGVETANRLCVTNPMAVFEGRPLPPLPELGTRMLDDDDADKPSIWSRIFG